MLAILFPQIDPVVFTIFNFDVYWYSFAYIFGIIFGYLVITKLNANSHAIINKKILDDLLIYIVLGTVIGGRLGYIIFYDLQNTFLDPLRIFMIRKGGMSFHGGMLGVTLSTYFVCKKYNISFLKVIDQISVVAPIGIFLGRIANFIRGELFGKITNVPWGVIFPHGGNLPRHPSQLYEAIGEGLLLFIILLFIYLKTSLRKKPGCTGACFLIFYGIARMTVEIFREPNIHIGYFLDIFTLGQLLSLPMILFGLYFIIRKS